MSTAEWFDSLPVLGKMPTSEAAAKLREVGEDALAAALESGQAGEVPSARAFGLGDQLRDFLSVGERPFRATAHTFGYVGVEESEGEFVPVRHVSNLKPDNSLKNARIKIALSRVRVADYPGGGTHLVLFDFYAQNQLPGEVEHLHYNATVRAYEGQQAALINFPIFVGLHVGTEGAAFKCYTVNVKNEQDEDFLGFLESEVFRSGLKLAAAAQPAIAPLSQMALNLTKSIANRHRNLPVQEFQMGLDFSPKPFGACLREGAYIAVQIPANRRALWKWDEWVYSLPDGEIVSVADRAQLIPHNYIVFTVTRYEGE